MSPDLVIAEIYGGGGNSGATFSNDFVVVFNRDTVDASLTGVKLWYASAAGNFGNAIALDQNVGTLGAGKYLLVTLGGGNNAGTSMLPAGDLTSTLNISSSAGKLALSKASLGSCGGTTACSESDLIDLVGWGTGTSGANASETAATAGTSSTTKMIVRKSAGCVDDGDNATDLALQNAGTPPTSATTAIVCPVGDDGGSADAAEDLSRLDLAKAHDLSSTDLASVDLTSSSDMAGTNVLLNEVKWNPGGSDDGQEYVELIGTGTLPAHTYVLSVDGDTTSLGNINFAIDIGGKTFGSNGLLLIQAAATTIAGVDPSTTLVKTALLNTGAIQNGSETVMVVSAPGTLTISTTSPKTKLGSLAGVTILDSIAALDTTGSRYGNAGIAACPTMSPSAVDAAYRIVGDGSAQTTSAWYAGQVASGGAPTSTALIDGNACSSGPASLTLTPGRANDDPITSALDMSTPDDLSGPSGDDLSVEAEDFAVPSDLATTSSPDLARTFVTSHTSGGGCSMTRSPAPTAMLPFALLLLLGLVRRRRTM